MANAKLHEKDIPAVPPPGAQPPAKETSGLLCEPLKKWIRLEREDIRVLPLDQVYTVNLDEGEYWLLAEKPDFWMLGVRTDGRDRDVWLLSYDAFPAERLSSSFRDALEKARELE